MNLRSRHGRDEKALVARAALLRAVARAFAIPAPGHVDGLRRMFASLPAEYPAARSETARRLACARRALRGATEETWAAQYLRLYHGSGPVRLHETAYGDGRRFAGREVELADLNGFYRAFGLHLAQSDPDLPDHLSVELEFLSLLRLKESYALARNDRPAARVTAGAAKTFLEQHLGRWTRHLVTATCRAEAGSPFREQVLLVAALVDGECHFERARPRRFSEHAPADDMQGETFNCPFEEAAASGR